MRIQIFSFFVFLSSAVAQSIAVLWSGHGHDPQHTGLSKIASQPLTQVRWQMPVDLMPQYQGNSLLVHYAAPVITRQNTVIVPVKTGADGGFRIEARDGRDGNTKWMLTSDYVLPAHGWVPMYGIALTPKNRVYYPGIGGTVYYRDSPDAPGGAMGQIAFYGLANYQNDSATFNARVKINTPITADRYGNIFFGFQVTSPGTTNPSLQSGMARIAEDGTGSWVSVLAATGDSSVANVAQNCTPALSNDQRTLYFAVNSGNYTAGYLVSVDSRTMAPIAKMRLKDALNPGNDALVPDNGSAAPTVGPDGDVYYGVLENPFLSNNVRGYLLPLRRDAGAGKDAGRIRLG